MSDSPRPHAPLARFAELLAQAKSTPGHADATAMTLATVGPDARPSLRVVLLKGCDDHGLVFYTNTQSRKGRELATNPNIAVDFWWPHIGWQVRFEGAVTPVSDAEADAYFASRARGSQLGAWASQQSEPLASRAELEERLAELTRRYEGQPVPRPPHWSGYRLAPSTVEFWRDRANRLHERDLYVRAPDGTWSLRLLNP